MSEQQTDPAIEALARRIFADASLPMTWIDLPDQFKEGFRERAFAHVALVDDWRKSQGYGATETERVGYALQHQLNPGTPDAYWCFADVVTRDTEAEALTDLANAVGHGCAEDQLRVVGLVVARPRDTEVDFCREHGDCHLGDGHSGIHSYHPSVGSGHRSIGGVA